MRYLAILLLAALGGLFFDDGERDGRRGNAHYEAESYPEAAEAYSSGIAVLAEDAPMRLRYGLHNNLGAALLKSGDAAAAGQAFERALNAATSDVDIARTAYNTGNAAYAVSDLEAAVSHYRSSLLREPNNEDAKFNYEFAKRQLEEQQQQQNQQQQQQGGDSEQEREQENEGEQNEEGPQNDEQQQNGDEQQDAEPQEQEGQQQQQQPSQGEGEHLSEAQAERILQALQNEEEQLLRQVQRPSGRTRNVEKDW